jgi:hypothetical protein
MIWYPLLALGAISIQCGMQNNAIVTRGCSVGLSFALALASLSVVVFHVFCCGLLCILHCVASHVLLSSGCRMWRVLLLLSATAVASSADLLLADVPQKQDHYVSPIEEWDATVEGGVLQPPSAEQETLSPSETPVRSDKTVQHGDPGASRQLQTGEYSSQGRPGMENSIVLYDVLCVASVDTFFQLLWRVALAVERLPSGTQVSLLALRLEPPSPTTKLRTFSPTHPRSFVLHVSGAHLRLLCTVRWGCSSL